MERRHDDQASEIRATYSGSFRTEVLSFQKPGPGGTTSGIESERHTPQWSEKGQGTILHEETEDTHENGTPKRSIRDARLPSHLVQVKPEEEGWRYLQISITHQSSKRYLSEEELSREEVDKPPPARSRERSKTSLKSPQRTVGIEGSILE